jgi:hypothetical protein
MKSLLRIVFSPQELKQSLRAEIERKNRLVLSSEGSFSLFFQRARLEHRLPLELRGRRGARLDG